MQFETSQLSRLAELPYLGAASGGGVEQRQLGVDLLPVHNWVCHARAIVLCADLQGVCRNPESGVLELLGIGLARELTRLSKDGRLPAPSEIGVAMAGDFYSHPRAQKRGATGPVVSVWQAFANHFAWVTGVLGNHDLIAAREQRDLTRHGHVSILDGDRQACDGLTIAGVSGIIGRKGKPHRRSLASYTGLLHEVLHQQPDILVLHDGPQGPARGQRGHTELTRCIASSNLPLLVRGHDHWHNPFATLGHTQVINVDARAMVLIPADHNELTQTP